MLYGWDISTAVIGVSEFDGSSFLDSSFCDLRKVEGLNQKADVARKFISDLAATSGALCGDVHFIEDRLAGFSGGGSNAGTVMRLAAFNAMVCWMIWTFWKESDLFVGPDIIMLHPSTVKATMKHEGLIIPKGADKKKLTLEFVTGKEKKFPLVLNKNGNPQPYCYDMADAYITAVAGMKKNPGCVKS